MTKPNILFVIADDWAWPHASAYGARFVTTPSFDRVAKEGILFNNAFCNAPQCSPARASVLTGMNFWRLEEGSELGGFFPKKYQVYPDILKEHGYHTGHTGKGWAPGVYLNDDGQITGSSYNNGIKGRGNARIDLTDAEYLEKIRVGQPAGKVYNDIKQKTITNKQRGTDYFENFRVFLKERKEGQPFCFWYGANEPHRPYEEGSGIRAGKTVHADEIPAYLPDTPEIRSDMADHALMVEWFDMHLGKMLDYLEEIGELENTLVMVTGDNGWSFPRAKSNLYRNSTHVPFALRWGKRTEGNRVVDDFIGFPDIMPTILEAAGIETDIDFSGRSLINIIADKNSGQIDAKRKMAVTGFERHTICRDNLCYPMRSIHTSDYLYIKNYHCDRWPAGNPETGFRDCDSGQSKTYIIEHQYDELVSKYFELAFGKRPHEELYDLKNDPGCIHNVADNHDYKEVKARLREELEQYLIEEKDPREMGYGEIFDSYPNFQAGNGRYY